MRDHDQAIALLRAFYAEELRDETERRGTTERERNSTDPVERGPEDLWARGAMVPPAPGPEPSRGREEGERSLVSVLVAAASLLVIASCSLLAHAPADGHEEYPLLTEALPALPSPLVWWESSALSGTKLKRPGGSK